MDSGSSEIGDSPSEDWDDLSEDGVDSPDELEDPDEPSVLSSPDPEPEPE